MKKILSMVLVVVLIFSIIPTGVMAAEGMSTTQIIQGIDAFKAKYPEGAANPEDNCYDFISRVCRSIFGEKDALPSQYREDPNNLNQYAFASNFSNYLQIGDTLVIKNGNLSKETLKKLFLQSKPGDVVQMGYTKAPNRSGNRLRSRHVMMVYSASSTGVVFYHAGSKIYFGVSEGNDKLYGDTGEEISWEELEYYFCHDADGISLYRSKKATHKIEAIFTEYDESWTYSANHDMTISVFGGNSCYNTKTMLDTIVDAGIDKMPNVRVLQVDIEGKTKEELQAEMNAYKDTGILFAYDTSTEAYEAMWSFARKAGFTDGITTPLLVFRKSDGTIFRTFQGVIEEDYLLQLAKGDTSGEEIVELKVTGEENYSNAFRVLDELNKLRKSVGLSQLTMDQELMRAAMQRAAELSVYYSHTRPNGKTCFTATNSTSGSMAENIAMGQRSAEDVMYSWRNSSGHYKNMTGTEFASVGIGCFEMEDGKLCWVQLFSSTTSNNAMKFINRNATYYIQAQKVKLGLGLSVDKDLHTLKKGKTAKVTIWNTNRGNSYFRQKVSVLTFKLSSSNNKIATISSGGTCTVKGNGKVTITAVPKSGADLKLKHSETIGHTYTNSCDTSCNYCGKKRSITHKYKTTVKAATVSKDGSKTKKCTVCGKKKKTTIEKIKSVKLSSTSYTYSGEVEKPKVKVKDSDGEKLKEGTDYKVSYSKGCEKVGTYKVTVKFKGEYSGTETLKFKINPRETKVSEIKAGKGKLSVKISKKKTQNSGYQLQGSSSKKFKNARTITLKGYDSTKYTFKGLKSRKTYYVRVRAYKTVDGKKYYSDWSSYKSKKTK